MKKITALVLAAAVLAISLVSLSSCGNSGVPKDFFREEQFEEETEEVKETLAGTWVTSLDFQSIFEESLNEEDAFFFSLFGFDFTGVTVDMYIDFYEDGTYYSEADEEQLTAIAEELLGGLASVGLSFAGLSTGGADCSGLLGNLLMNNVIDADEVFSSTRTEGYYDYTDGILTIDDASFYATIDGDVLILDSVISAGADDDRLTNLPGYLLPLPFYRF